MKNGATIKILLVAIVLLLSDTGSSRRRRQFPPQLKQWHNCNNCFAITAYDIIKYHQPRLNLTVRGLMEETKQTCNGGVPTTILNRYFPRGSRKATGSLLTLKRVLRNHGPCIISYGRGHVVTAVQADEKTGVIVQDPADGQTKLIALREFTRRQESLYFNYIVYPLV